MQVLILHLGSIITAPRPQRMASTCQQLGYKISCMSAAGGGIPDAVHCYELPQLSSSVISRSFRKILGFLGGLLTLLSIDMEPFYRFMFRYGVHLKPLLQKSYDIIIVENLELLPLAFKIRNGAKILFDAREYYPKEFESSLSWQVSQRLACTAVCQKYLHQCDAVITVSPGILEEYKKVFGINPVLVRSIPFYCDYPIKPMAENIIRMVHHGAANEDRNLEKMISLFAKLDARFYLDFYLTGKPAYIARLKEKAEPYSDRIRFLSPVPYREILPTLNHYDMGLCYFEPHTFNLARCLPNKFFEFIQARLAVIIGPSPDMAALVRQYDCGAVSADFAPETMSDLLNNLREEDVLRMKAASNAAAHDLCYEQEHKKLINLLAGLSGKR